MNWKLVSIISLFLDVDCGLSSAEVVSELCFALNSASSPLCARDHHFIALLAVLINSASADRVRSDYPRNTSYSPAIIISERVTLSDIENAVVLSLHPGDAATKIVEMVMAGGVKTTSDRIPVLIGALIRAALTPTRSSGDEDLSVDYDDSSEVILG